MKHWLKIILCCIIIGGVWTTQAVLAADDAQWQKDRNLGLQAFKKGRFIFGQGRRCLEGEKFLSAAVKEAEAFGPQDTRLATSLNDLAGLYRVEERYTEAEPLFKRSLTIRERALGPNHPDVACVLDGLAALYVEQSKYTEAESLYKRSLAIKEKVYGPDYYHCYVAVSLHNLADLYDRQGKYTEAEPLYKRELAIEEKWFGPNHSYVEMSLNALADLYYREGKYTEAEPLYKRLLALAENPSHHPDNMYLAAILNDVARVYLAQGKYAEAEPLFKRSLAMTEKLLGPNHYNFEVAERLEDYASLLRKTNRAKEAEELEARAKAIRSKTYGK